MNSDKNKKVKSKKDAVEKDEAIKEKNEKKNIPEISPLAKATSVTTKKEKENFEQNANLNSSQEPSKGEKITEIQKKVEKKMDIFNEDKQTMHPDHRQYDPDDFKKKDGPKFPIKKIAVSESLTAGKLADLLASHDYAGSFFIGSMSVYTLKHKSKLLGVDENHADEVDCVSPKVCCEMASGVLEMFRDEADVGVGVTGFAKTEGVPDLKPHAYYCIIDKDGNKRQGKVEEGLEHKERNEVRKIVAERVYLECCKVIGLKPDPDVCKRHECATIKEELSQKENNEEKEGEKDKEKDDEKEEEIKDEEEEEEEKEKTSKKRKEKGDDKNNEKKSKKKLKSNNLKNSPKSIKIL